MKGWRVGCLVGLILLLAAGGLYWFLPARWASSRLQKNWSGWQLQDTHGLLWNGSADMVWDKQQQPLGRLQWQLSRLAPLGRGRLAVQFQGASLDFRGLFGKAADQAITLHDGFLHADLDAFADKTDWSWGSPRGQFDAQIRNALVQGQWPLELDATLHWHQAQLMVAGDAVPLGELQLELRGSRGVINGQLQDDGRGPLHVDGQALLSPLGWRYAIELSPRDDRPALRHWLSTLGVPDAAGRWHLSGAGGLGAPIAQGKTE